MRQGGIPFGLLYVLGAAIGWAAGTIYLKHCPIDADPIALTLWQVVVAVVVCTAGMLAFESPSLDLATPRATAAFLYHVALPQSTAYLLWFSLIRQVPPTTAAIGTLLIPIFGVLGSIILLEDWPGATDWIGLLIILSAVALDQFRTRPLPR
jgi:drug/metabolite transporter (DMT)-like permease